MNTGKIELGVGLTLRVLCLEINTESHTDQRCMNTRSRSRSCGPPFPLNDNINLLVPRRRRDRRARETDRAADMEQQREHHVVDIEHHVQEEQQAQHVNGAQRNQAQAERNEQQAYVNINMAQRNERQDQQNQQQANRNEQQAQFIPQHQAKRRQDIPPVFVGENDRTNAHQHRAGIQAPPLQNNNFEVKASLLNMVHNSKFHGLPMEDPLEHLDQFDRVCDLTKINGVSEDSFKLRTAKLRNQISSFKQHNNESFGEAWERFRSYTNQCPHHAYSDASLLSTLYRGALPQIRNQLDTASNGNFLAKEITSAMELVENLAMSNDTYGEDYDRTNRSEASGSDQRLTREVKELRSELEKLKLVSQKPIHYVAEFNDSPSFENINEDGLTEEKINYIGNQQRYQRFNNYGANQNLSYRNPNVASPQDHVYHPQQNQQCYATKTQFQSSFQPKPQFSQPQQQYTQPQHQIQGTNFSSQHQQLKAPPGFSEQPMG
ncbi:protein kinase 4-like [Eutrema salsugineum]|uniref:protein kinase 4-like n=1 Tax=Eutrema salsugineum TaxID=72664 RepID=UPI000CED6D92|nr:protein kinase 4-like [Eutrema salsugineum]